METVLFLMGLLAGAWVLWQVFSLTLGVLDCRRLRRAHERARQSRGW